MQGSSRFDPQTRSTVRHNAARAIAPGDIPYEVSDDATRLDIPLIHSVLASSYWSPGIPRAVIERALKHSLCFGVYRETAQVAFARVISDFATFAYLADVFVLEAHRARGVAKLLLRSIVSHRELQGLRRFLLATRDAHGLYAQFGFEPLSRPLDFMTIHNPEVYQRGTILRRNSGHHDMQPA